MPAAQLPSYLGLVTSEHASQPDYRATLTALLQPFVDGQNVLSALPAAFDVDVAVGSQLDDVGEWVNRDRYIELPLTGVYFSFDVVGVGFDQGIWYGPYDPTAGLVPLDDATYRALLKAQIEANAWDGSIPGAYAIVNAFFSAANAPFNSVLIQDNGDMTMTIGVVGPAPTPLVQALLQAGVLDVRPSGVGVLEYLGNPFWPAPFFGFDVQNATIRGFDQGYFAVDLPFQAATQVGAFTFNFNDFLAVALMSGV